MPFAARTIVIVVVVVVVVVAVVVVFVIVIVIVGSEHRQERAKSDHRLWVIECASKRASSLQIFNDRIGDIYLLKFTAEKSLNPKS